MRLLRESLSLLVLAAIPALLCLGLHPRKPAFSWSQPDEVEVELSEVSGWKHPFIWVDARSEADYERRHIPGAVSLNEDTWDKLIPDFLSAWRPGVPIVVYCDSQKCDASKEVARRLRREFNLSNVHVLKGGWASWLKSHL